MNEPTDLNPAARDTPAERAAERYRRKYETTYASLVCAQADAAELESCVADLAALTRRHINPAVNETTAHEVRSALTRAERLVSRYRLADPQALPCNVSLRGPGICATFPAGVPISELLTTLARSEMGADGADE